MDKRFVGWQSKSSYHDGSSFGCSSAPRNDGDQPLSLVQLQQATRMLAMSILTHSLFLRHTIIKISHKSRRLSLNISSQVFFTCAYSLLSTTVGVTAHCVSASTLPQATPSLHAHPLPWRPTWSITCPDYETTTRPHTPRDPHTCRDSSALAGIFPHSDCTLQPPCHHAME